MTGADGHDAIVIGAGIVGAACAESLSADGMRVLVLDASMASGGTTAVGMGHVTVMDDSGPQLDLTAYSVRLWKALAPELTRPVEMDPCGTVWVAEDDAQLAAVATKQSVYASAGVRSEILDAKSLKEAEPQLRDGLPGGLHVPGDCVVYPPGATRFLLDRVTRRGGTLREHTRVDELVAGGVRCGSETLKAPIVVNAAGAAAAALTPQLPIVPRKGHLAITDRYPGFCRHQLVELGYLTSAHAMTQESVACNIQPRPTGQMLIGSSREFVDWNASMNPKILRKMLDRAVAFLPALAKLSVIRTWTGFRPAVTDKLPLIGRWEPVPGLWMAAGHEGLGITTSLATGAILADLIAGRAPKITATPFDPMRVA